MSGGTWNYVGYRIKQGLLDIADPEFSTLQKDMPTLAKVFEQLAEAIDDIEHELDWHYASDSLIKDIPAFEQWALRRLYDSSTR